MAPASQGPNGLLSEMMVRPSDGLVCQVIRDTAAVFMVGQSPGRRCVASATRLVANRKRSRGGGHGSTQWLEVGFRKGTGGIG